MSGLRKRLDTALNEIREMVLEMSSYVEESMRKTIETVKEKKYELIDEILKVEDRSDLLNLQVDEKCLSVVALQQPVAKDLRFIHTMLRISTNFERICDIFRKTSFIIRDLIIPEELRLEILRMLEILTEMLKVDVNGLREMDTKGLIDELTRMDDEVDVARRRLEEEIIEMLDRGLLDARSGVNLVKLLLYLERVGDILAKTGSRLIYAVEGRWVWIK